MLVRSSLRSQPYINWLPAEVVGRTRHKKYRRRHSKSCAFLNNIWIVWRIVLMSAFCRCLNLQELITLRQDSPQSAHCNPLRQRQNQSTKMQHTHNRACARAATYVCNINSLILTPTWILTRFLCVWALDPGFVLGIPYKCIIRHQIREEKPVGFFLWSKVLLDKGITNRTFCRI